MPTTDIWIKKQQFNLRDGAIDSIGHGVIICQLSVERRSRCGCIYTRYETLSEHKVKIVHADNPEHTIEVNSDDFETFCTQGHLATLCEWVSRVIDYAHPVELIHVS